MLFFLGGFLLGTLLEYLIHRAIGHGPGSERSQSPLLSRHATVHHRVFTERRGFSAARGETRREHINLQASAVFILIGTIVATWAGLFGLSGMSEEDLLAPGSAMMIAGGLLASLAAYMITHWLHHTRPPGWVMGMPPYKQLRAWHQRHHQEPDSRFAVIMPLWDLIFFTHVGTPELEATPRTRPTAAPAESPATTPRTREGRRRPGTTLAQMMEQTLAAAEADLFGEDEEGAEGGKKDRPRSRLLTRRGKSSPGEKVEDDDASASTRPQTGPGLRPPTTVTGNGSGSAPEAGKSRPAGGARKGVRGAGWLNTVDDPAAPLQVSVKAVRDEDE